MKISIAMATYNGECFVARQLQSFLDQTRKPDEVIIFDDCSKDNTVNTINDFISRNQLHNWKLYINGQNEGWQKNFINATDKTSGDIIFFSDQDDIWIEDRIEVMAKAMEENDNVLALSGYRTVIDEFDKPAVGTYPYPISANTKKLTKLPFNEKNCFLIQSGCVTAFRRSIYSHMKELWIEKFSHDILVWRIACILDGAYSIDFAVLKYRVHSSNSSGVSTSNYIGQGSIEKRIAGINGDYNWISLYFFYFSKINLTNKNEKLKVIQNCLKFLQVRENFLSNKNIWMGIKLLKYINYYQLKSKYFGDLLYAYKLNKIGGNIFWQFIRR